MWERFLVRIGELCDRLESGASNLIYDRKTTLGFRILGGLAVCLSKLFEGIVQCRHWLYSQGMMRQHRLGCSVIVVGNLSVGGTGKTPVVEYLARHLQEKGRKVAILSRGYKAKPDPFWKTCLGRLGLLKESPVRVVSDGHSVLLGPDVSGDEPYMLARNVPGVVVLVDKDRVRAGRFAVEKFGINTLILDDGLQYLKLKGHLNFLLMDAQDPVGNGYLLPRGILREPVSYLSRASCVLVTRSKQDSVDPKLHALIRAYNQEADILPCQNKPEALIAYNAQADRAPLETLVGKTVLAFSGIARPENFEGLLKDLGARLLATQRYTDHHRFSLDEIQALFAQARHAKVDFIVTTEKDRVRLPQGLKPPVPLYYVRLSVDLFENDLRLSRILKPLEGNEATPLLHLTQERMSA